MARYIDADKLKKALKELPEQERIEYMGIYDAINFQPTADVQEVKHKAIRIDNLMYVGCEPHWKCVNCGECVPFHCYTKSEFEDMNCKEPNNKKCTSCMHFKHCKDIGVFDKGYGNNVNYKICKEYE